MLSFDEPGAVKLFLFNYRTKEVAALACILWAWINLDMALVRAKESLLFKCVENAFSLVLVD